MALDRRAAKSNCQPSRSYEHFTQYTLEPVFPAGMVLDRHITGKYEESEQPPPRPKTSESTSGLGEGGEGEARVEGAAAGPLVKRRRGRMLGAAVAAGAAAGPAAGG